MAETSSEDLGEDGLTRPPDASAFHEIIIKMRKAEGMSQAELARRIRMTQTYISRWEQTRIPSLEHIWRLEVHGFRVPPGTIARKLGFVSEEGSVSQAIAEDPALGIQAKAVLSAGYEAALKTN